MSTQKHIIEKTSWDISISTEHDEHRVSNDIRDVYYTFLNDNLSSQLDELVSGNEHVVIDRIVIDLGRISKKKLASEIRKKLKSELVSIIEPKVRNQQKNQFIQSRHSVRETEHQDVMDAFLYFLKQGQLPWWYHVDGRSLADEVLEYIAYQDSTIILNRLKLLTESTIMLDRFVFQFSLQYIQTFLNQLKSHSSKRMKKVMKNWVQELASRKVRGPKKVQKALSIGLLFLNDSQIEAWSKTISEKESNLDKPMQKLIFGLAQMPQGIVEQVVKRVSFDQQELEQMNRSGSKPTASNSIQKPDRAEWLSNQEKTYFNKELEQILDFDMHSNEKEDTWYIDNAGLVLLWPYVAELFNKLDWTENGLFISKKTQRKAIAITHFLATGKTRSPEYDLTMSKLLCGWPLKKPLKKNEALNEEQLTLANQLLEAVIKNWSAIGNTSTEGIQQSFLQRIGKLKKQGENWKLTVEKQSYDMLLDQIPWGYGMIKFPWNEYIINVDW